MPFTIRQFNHQERLGDKLKALRKEANLTLTQMAEKTKIRKQFLKQLESGQYDKLPDPIYTRNFLKVYLHILNTEDLYFLDLFEHERGTCDFIKQACLPRQRTRSLRFFVASRFIKIGLFSFMALSVVFYFGIQIRTIIMPPKLSIFEPLDGIATQDATISVSGQAENGAGVKINGTEVLMEKDGTFKLEIALERGLNIIKIEGMKRYSKPAVEYRRVVLNQDRTVTITQSKNLFPEPVEGINF
ncbi:helix-turn-helix domain-containing protein [Candidatus Uhrbacteria bacterium]|nr:helix-turn-helix domain-containing protein [Candidatus Uhrbacteria bacterium]